MTENPTEHWDWALIRRRCRAEAGRILRRDHDADEVVQEALTRAWRSRRNCRTPEDPLPWCLQITRNEAFRLIGRQQSRASLEPLDADVEIADENAVRETERTLSRLAVGTALRELTERERTLIVLRYQQGCSHPQIAATLEIPEATARVRLHRAQKRLRSLLDDDA